MNGRYLWGTILIVLTLCGCSNNDANNESSSFVKYGISNGVKSVKVLSYKAVEDFENIDKGDILNQGNYTMKFDNSGNCIEIANYSAKGELSSKTLYEYASDTQMLIKEKYYSSSNELGTEKTYEYDGSFLSSRIDYDPDAKDLIKYVISSHIYMKFEYTNDTKHITGFTRYDDEKKSAVFKYVWTDNVAQIVAYDASGTTKTGHYRIEEYDSYDRIIKMVYGDTGTTCEVEYNEKGLPIYLKNAHMSNTTVVFDPYNKTEKTLYYTYTYDKKGNWIERIEYEGVIKKPTAISTQTIEY